MNNDGGSAFPHNELRDNFSDCAGMSLRDYFAAAALPAIYTPSSDGSKSGVARNNSWIAERAYAMADAMLKARGASRE